MADPGGLLWWPQPSRPRVIIERSTTRVEQQGGFVQNPGANRGLSGFFAKLGRAPGGGVRADQVKAGRDVGSQN